MNRMVRPGEIGGAASETLSGTVERVTFHSAESGFCVLKVHARGKGRFPRDLVPVVGHAPAVGAGEWITAAGRWVSDREHGAQFKAQTLTIAAPTGVEGIARYLASGQMRGIGPRLAERIVAAFGEDVFAVIEAEPERLAEVEGIGPTRVARIVRGWSEQRAVREITIFLHAHGVGTARATRVFRTYGADALRVMREDPYRLARDIRGIGFRTADALALRLGTELEAPKRLAAGVAYALQSAMDEGHCGLPAEDLAQRAARLLGVGRDLTRVAVALAARAGSDVVADTLRGETCLFLRGLHGAERAIGERLLARLDGAPPWPRIEADKAQAWVEARTGRRLSASQGGALRLILESRLCVMTGGPGVGKTATLDAILRVLTAKGVRVQLAAPTGRAAKRMAEQTGLEARTIHRLLEIDPRSGGFARGLDNPLDCDLLVLDEASMIDVPLMHAVLKALPEPAALLLVGDADQLPSVGPGQVLADVIASERVPVVRLTEVFRQAAESRIVAAAHRIKAGRMPEPAPRGTESDFHLVETHEGEDALPRLIAIVARAIPRRFGLDPARDVQVLTPMARGSLGSRSLNHALQRVLNPSPAVQVERFGWRFAPGDRVMETRNDYDRDVFNGDLGTVQGIDETEGSLSVAFDGRVVVYPLDELDTLVPAFATTIHKSQGSEYPAVVIPVALQHARMLARNLLYTGVTRGRRLVVLVGERRALAIAVRGRRGVARRTKLREWLENGDSAM